MSDRDRLVQKLRVLELDIGVTAADVKSAYRELVKVWHPDRFEVDQQVKERAEKKLKELNEAYDWLITREHLLGEQPHARADHSAAGKPPSRVEYEPSQKPSSPYPANPSGVRRPPRFTAPVVGLVTLVVFSLAVAFSVLTRESAGIVNVQEESPTTATPAGVDETLPKLLAEARANIVVNSINAWAVADVPIQPAWSTFTSLRELPSSVQELAALIHESHAKLIRELTVNQAAVERSVKGFDPTRFCLYTIYGQERDRNPESVKTIEIVRDHFADRIVDIASGKGRYSGRYPFEFDWFVVLEVQTRVIYSFIFNLQD